MQKISSKKVENIRKKSGYSTKRIFRENFCVWLKEKQNFHENELPSLKTIQRIEHDNEISKKYKELLCNFLDINPKEIELVDDAIGKDEIIERYKEIDTGLESVRLLNKNDLPNLSPFKKNIFITKPYNINLEETRYEEIWNTLSEILKLLDPYTIMANHGNDPSNEIKRTNLFTKLHNLIDNSPCKLFFTSFQYTTYWPYPSDIHDSYMEQRFDEEGSVLMDDIYTPKTNQQESFNGDWYLLPVAMHYQVFILSDNQIESVRYDDEAGRIVLSQAFEKVKVDEDNMSEDAYEDYIHFGPIYRRKLRGTYRQVLEKINNTYDLVNYIDSSNIEVIFKPQILIEPELFNINDYSNNELTFIDRVLADKNFYKYFGQEKLKNFDETMNKNFHTRLEFLERANLKKNFFDGVSSLYKHKSWASVETDEQLLNGILSGSAKNISDHIDFKIEEAQMDHAYDDGFYPDAPSELSKHEFDASIDHEEEEKE